ncbi:uncharacterized protein LOC128237331 [Mya arenaria]|uniref:uncharacterized protein LOC128237331 n=1 Tax=Mya arenaria TaxID=6604 RepID=UPI0022DFB096|nr:uncharacterized protein LOC128237331 [Mya arenaria]
MGSTRTIEDYVEEIVGYITEVDFDNMSSVCDTLEKMKFSSKSKYKLNYWRVMQCLGETASDRLVSFLIRMEKNSCKCHLNTNFKCFMRLFVEAMCNVKVIKRMLECQAKMVPLFFKGVRQTDEQMLNVIALESILKCVIVGKTETVELFVKYGLVKDLYLQIKLQNDVSNFSYGSINTVLYCSQLMYAASVCGSERIRKQVRRSNSARVLAEYIVKLEKNKVNKLGVEQLCKNFTEIRNVLGDEKEAEEAFKNWRPKERLQIEQEQDQMYTFCSSPSCRKIHADCDKFRYCGACRLARYCSEGCQKEHWKRGHKDACQQEALCL